MDNAGFAQRFFDGVWNAGNVALIDELVAHDCKILGLHEPMVGPAPFKAFHQAFHGGFKDFHINVDEEIVDGERVAIRCTVSCTHKKSGRVATFMGGGMLRIRDGRIVEAWNAWDFLGMLQQVGLVDPNAMAAALTPHAAPPAGRP